MTAEITKQQIDAAIKAIERMSHEEMASLHRYAPVGSIYFRRDLPTVRKAWTTRWKVFGGMNPQISKAIER